MIIDTSFDFRNDAGGKDPDLFSPTLRRYHQQLWSRPLPSGVVFHLDTATPFAYLHHRSNLGEFWLSSDAVIPTFGGWLAMRALISQLQPQGPMFPWRRGGSGAYGAPDSTLVPPM